MLQQTQMERAVAYFLRFTTHYANPAALAKAPQDELFKLWEGLGYYNRARNLQRAAQAIVTLHDGQVPCDRQALLDLPGIGPYTAGAVLSIAYNMPEPVVDANVERVLARLFNITSPVKQPTTRKQLAELATAMMPSGQARNFNQGLMELGALVCSPRQPRCSACPLAHECQALRLDLILERPVLPRPPQVIPLYMACGVLIHAGRIFVQKRPESGVWAGLWEFPGGGMEHGESASQTVAREFMEETDFTVHELEPFASVVHGYTKYRVTLHGCLCSLSPSTGDPLPTPVLRAAQQHRWVKPADLADLAFPAGHRKLIDRLHADLRFQSRINES